MDFFDISKAIPLSTMCQGHGTASLAGFQQSKLPKRMSMIEINLSFVHLSVVYQCVYIYIYPYDPCMEYLPTFALKKGPNVGKYAIHGASGIYIYILHTPIYDR